MSKSPGIMMVGCASGVGRTIRALIEGKGDYVFGVGRHGPNHKLEMSHFNIDYNEVIRAYNCMDDRNRYADTLIYNAGFMHMDYTANLPLEDFELVMAINCTWPFMFIREFLNRMLSLRKEMPVARFKIIVTSSMAPVLSPRGMVAYSASKAALESMVKTVGKEYAGYGLTICAIRPGGIEDTQMKEKCISSSMRVHGLRHNEAIEKFTGSPLGRDCTHHEVWKMYEFAIYELPEQATGSILSMSGGFGL